MSAVLSPARCSGADDWGGWGAPVALGGLHFDCSAACVPCRPLLLFWKGMSCWFCFILSHSYHVKNNQDILPEVFLCSCSVMTGPHLVLTSQTLFTIFSGHVLCPDGSRIVSPSVASLVYCTPSYLAAVFWKIRRKKKQLRYKTDPSGHKLVFPAGIPVSVHILHNSVFDFSLSISLFSIPPFPQTPHTGVIQPYCSFSCLVFVICS